MQKTPDFVIVIMAGGAGKRFWPLSTPENPKQFLTFFGDRSFLQMSYDLVRDMIPLERVLILTNREHVSKVAEQLPEIPRENIIGEPMRKDTAAASALAAFICRKRFGNPVMATLTADHLIEPRALFQKTLLSAIRMAGGEEVLYTIGISPQFPATGYGWLERGELILTDEGIRHYKLLGFKEKPDFESACQYLDSGTCFWNSGMFVWQADVIIDQIRNYLPRHAELLEPLMAWYGAARWESALEAAFRNLESVSIDYGIMERAKPIRCVEGTFSWSDVGGWNALRDHLPADQANNAHRGSILTLDARDNLIFCENPAELVMTIGVSDLVIVRVGTKTLIAHRDRVEDIKKLVQQLDRNTLS